MPDAYIVDAVRTPVGRYAGALSSVRPDDLAARVIAAAAERTDLPKGDVEDVFFGCTNAAGEDNRNVARMASLIAGLPQEVPGVTVNRLCASGLEAVNQAARSIMVGHGDLALGGGVESMSRSPFVMLKPERGFPRGDMNLVDTTLGWRFINPRLAENYSTDSMGETGENLAGKGGAGERGAGRGGVSRRSRPALAGEAHTRCVAGPGAGRFDDELVTVDA